MSTSEIFSSSSSDDDNDNTSSTKSDIFGSVDDDKSSTESDKAAPPIFNMALEEILDGSKSRSPSRLTKKVIERLLYYFDVRRSLKDSSDFVNAILNKAHDIRMDMGGSLYSTICQALRSYKTFSVKK